MVHTVKNCIDRYLVDERGAKIPTAYKFNDETGMVSLYVTGLGTVMVSLASILILIDLAPRSMLAISA